MLAALRHHVVQQQQQLHHQQQQQQNNFNTCAPPSFYSPLANSFGRLQGPGITTGNNAAVPPPVPQSVVRSASATSTTSSSQASLIGDVPPPMAHSGNNVCSSISLVNQVGAAPPQAIYGGQPITDTQVAHAHLNKQGHRPLGRTQSAPLPLGHPMLTGTGQLNIGQTHYENSDVIQNKLGTICNYVATLFVFLIAG